MARDRVTNVPLLLKAMQQQGLDAVVAVSPENFFYTGGKKILSAVSNRDWLAMSVTTLDAATALIVLRSEEEQTRSEAWAQDVRTYVRSVQSPIEVLVELLDEKGLARSRVGIEMNYLTAACYLELRSRLPDAALLACDDVFDQARVVKTRPEIETLRPAAKALDLAVLRALRTARPGDSEAGLVTSMLCNLMEIGGGHFREMSWGVASGPNIGVAHHSGGQRKLEDGDLVRVNLRSTMHEYWSHLYRMAVVGPAPERVRAWYEKARDIHYRAIERMVPGSRVCDLFEAAKRDVEATGIPFKGSLVGHSTGILRVETPCIQPDDPTVLEPDMVFSVEPQVAVPGYEKYFIEDLVLVTEGAPELLTDATDTRSLFTIG